MINEEAGRVRGYNYGLIGSKHECKCLENMIEASKFILGLMENANT